MDLLPEDFEKKLKTKIIGHPFCVYLQLDSTQITAEYMAEGGAQEGTVVFAYSQKKGRGKDGRWWYSPPGGAWFTVILKPHFLSLKANRINIAFTVAIAEVLSSFKNLQPIIKWPNDVLIKKKKICGILTQMKSSFKKERGSGRDGAHIEYALVGIGMNVNIEKENFPVELKDGVTSLQEEIGEEIVLEEFLSSLLQKMDEYYLMLKQHKFAEIQQRWQTFSLPSGTLVRTVNSKGSTHGQLVGTNEKGNLIIRYPHGQLEEIATGEIELLT